MARPHLIDGYVKTVLMGEDPFMREKLWQGLAHWQRGSTGQLDRSYPGRRGDGAVGSRRAASSGCPCIKLIGGYRDKIPAYGSTMCGDEVEGGLATPEDYGRYAEWLVKRGYKAIKLHTWMKPVSFAPDTRRWT